MATERGARLRAALETVRADFPDVVKEVRGRGLMLGMEFDDQSGAPRPAIREQAKAGTLGLRHRGHLLRDHGSAPSPPPAPPTRCGSSRRCHRTDAEIARLETGLRAVVGVLRDPSGRLV